MSYLKLEHMADYVEFFRILEGIHMRRKIDEKFKNISDATAENRDAWT